MVRTIKRGVVSTFRDFARAFRSFSHNSRAQLVSVFLQALGGGMIATVFALYVTSAHLGAATVGYVEGAFGLGTALIALIGPVVVATLGYRGPMAVALGLLVVSRAAQASVPVATALIALGLAVGLGDGFLRTVNSAYLSENSTHEVRSHLFSAEFLVRMSAVFVGGLMGGFLPRLIGGSGPEGFQWTITLGSILMAAGIVPVLFMREKTHGIRHFSRVQIQTAKTFSAWEHLGRLTAPQAFLAASGGLIAPFVPLYLNHSLGASVSQIGIIQGFSALVTGVAAFGTPAIARRFGGARSAVFLHAAALPLLFTVPFMGSLAVGVSALLGRSALGGVTGPLWNERSMRDVRAKDKPFVAGGLLFTVSIAAFLGNIAGGRLMETSYTAPYVPAAALCAVGTALTWLLWVRPARAAELGQLTALTLHAEQASEAA